MHRSARSTSFQALLELMRDSRFRVKVSAQSASPQAFAWETRFLRGQLVAEFGDRCSGQDCAPELAAVPDDGVLVDLLSEIAPSEKQRKALLSTSAELLPVRAMTRRLEGKVASSPCRSVGRLGNGRATAVRFAEKARNLAVIATPAAANVEG